MVHTRFSSASGTISEGSVSHAKRKLKLSPKKLKGIKMKSPVKSKKLKFHDDLFPPPKGMNYDIPVEKHKPAKVATLNKYEPVTDLRALLSATQLSSFTESCFGKFMSMPHFKIQHQLIHNLLLRQLNQPNTNEIWIEVGGMKLIFGLKEFATVTGLLCVGNVDKMQYSKPENSFLNCYYEGSNSVLKSSLKKSFFGKDWKNDNDAVKFAKLYFLHHFLLASNTDTQIPKGDFDLIDSEAFDQYPWGKVLI